MNAENVTRYLADRVRRRATGALANLPVRTETEDGHEADNHIQFVAESAEEVIPGNATCRVKGKVMLVQFANLASAESITENQRAFAGLVCEALNVPLYFRRNTPIGDPCAAEGMVVMICEPSATTIGTDGSTYLATAEWEAVVQF